MTAKELNQLYYLEKEIRMYERDLEKLKKVSIDKPEEKIRLDDMRRVLTELHGNAAVKRTKIMEYITNVEDSYIRQILYLRHIKCKSWVAVGIIMHTHEDTVKKAYYRFIKTKTG